MRYKAGNISGFGAVNTIMPWLRCCAFLFLLGGASAAIAQITGTCATPFSSPARAGLSLTIVSRSGEVDIVGSAQQGIRVTCTLEDTDEAKNVHIQFEQTGDFARLRLSGGPSNNVRIRIEIPQRTDLKLRVSAGEVRVDKVSGDKDISLSAGEIVVSNVTGAEYRSVDASVDVGAVSASAFGVGKGGFFRSFTRETPGGLYRLHAHLISGNVQLN
jgi:hypothetical protein